VSSKEEISNFFFWITFIFHVSAGCDGCGGCGSCGGCSGCGGCGVCGTAMMYY